MNENRIGYYRIGTVLVILFKDVKYWYLQLKRNISVTMYFIEFDIYEWH